MTMGEKLNSISTVSGVTALEHMQNIAQGQSSTTNTIFSYKTTYLDPTKSGLESTTSSMEINELDSDIDSAEISGSIDIVDTKSNIISSDTGEI